MIRSDFKPRIKDPSSTRKKEPQRSSSKSRSKRKDTSFNPANKSKNAKQDQGKMLRETPLPRGVLKENKPVNQNTPKRAKIYRGDFMQDDRLSEIKFISKECSSIKENHNDDCISFSNSGNNLDEFSPLFDRSEKESNSKGDFTLEIYAIEDLDSYYQVRSQKNMDQPSREGGNSNAKSGRIKKNKTLATLCSQPSKKFEIDAEILEIFRTLDHSQCKILSKQNCSSEKLSTELNYLIGSVLNKIKVKGKEYDYKEFEAEFKSLIDGSEMEEILEILSSNQKKRMKLTHALKTETIEQHENLHNSNLQKNECRELLSPQFKKVHKKEEGMAQKLNKISNKLNLYLAKINLQTSSQKQPKSTHFEVQCETLDSQREDYDGDYRRNKDKEHFPRQEPIQFKNCKTSQIKTLATQNSNVSSDQFPKSQVHLRPSIEVIKRTDGSIFELYFAELKKHLD